MSKIRKRLAALFFVLAMIPAVNPAQTSGLKIKSGIDPAVLAKAKAGDAEAQFSVATAYRNGLGVPKDQVKSVSWLRKSAEQDLPYAQYDLGLCYSLGKGVTKDDAQAAAWYHKAASQGQSDAMRALAMLYDEGKGVQKDTKQAFELFSKAALEGDAYSQFQLGIDYGFGYQGAKQDENVAAEWFRKSAEQGIVGAQVNLAMHLHNQPEEVYYWLSLAAPHLTGDTLDRIAKVRDAAAVVLTPAKHAEIDERIKQWQDARKPQQ